MAIKSTFIMDHLGWIQEIISPRSNEPTVISAKLSYLKDNKIKIGENRYLISENVSIVE